MRDEIRVRVADYGRKFLYMRYRDPITGKMHARSTGTANRREAERAAAKWEAELHEGRYKKPSKVFWTDFRKRYEDEVIPGLATKTARKIAAMFNAIEELIEPHRLAAFDAAEVSRFTKLMREKRKVSEATIKGHLAALKAALRWAKSVGLLHAVPNIEMPQRARSSKMMKGRPITAEEFDRIIEKVEAVVGPEAAPSWKQQLRGLWWSGLRLAEALDLWWDRDDRLHVDLTGRRPMLRVHAEFEKGNRDRLLPIAPEFGEMLLAIPEAERTGRVFAPAPTRGSSITTEAVGRIISRIGEKAGVKVNTDPRSGKVKYASSHDFRRSFGERWAARIMPKMLMELMRHESIETTMKYYVGQNAQATADALWDAIAKTAPDKKESEVCNTSCNTSPEAVNEADTGESASDYAEEGYADFEDSGERTRTSDPRLMNPLL